MKEANLLKSLHHENIVKIEDSFQYDNFQKFGMLLEFCDGGDLSKYIKERKHKKIHLEESKIIEIFKQILDGLEYLHSKKIIHRDLKSLNIFLHKDGRVKIGDLGIAKVLLYSSCAHTIIGDSLYLAPEICQEKPYNEKSDIWSLGCVLYELITFNLPFNAPNYVGLCAKISKGLYDPITNEIKKIYSSDLLKLIEIILQKNPEKRPSVKELKKLKIFNSENEKLKLNEIKKPSNEENIKNIINEDFKKNFDINNKGLIIPNRPSSANVNKEIKNKINFNEEEKNKNFNYDKFIKNRLENAEKQMEIKNKKIMVNNNQYLNNNYIQQNNLFNKKNLNQENNINNNKHLPIDKFKIEVKKPVELKKLLIEKENINNNNLIVENKNYHFKQGLDNNNNFEKYKKNECVNRYNNILENIKNILEESKIPIQNKIFQQNEIINKNREIKSAQELNRNLVAKNNEILQPKKICDLQNPLKKKAILGTPKRVRLNPKGVQGDILVSIFK